MQLWPAESSTTPSKTAHPCHLSSSRSWIPATQRGSGLCPWQGHLAGVQLRPPAKDDYKRQTQHLHDLVGHGWEVDAAAAGVGSAQGRCALAGHHRCGNCRAVPAHRLPHTADRGTCRGPPWPPYLRLQPLMLNRSQSCQKNCSPSCGAWFSKAAQQRRRVSTRRQAHAGRASKTQNVRLQAAWCRGVLPPGLPVPCLSPPLDPPQVGSPSSHPWPAPGSPQAPGGPHGRPG